MRSSILLLALSLASTASAQEYVTIRGQVKWKGTEVPKLKPINAAYLPKDFSAPMPTDILVDAKSLGFRNVVVWLRPDTDDLKDPFPVGKVKKELREVVPSLHSISMAGFNYEPRIIAARAGDKIAVKNNTPVPNNFKYDGGDNSGNWMMKPGDDRLFEKSVAVQLQPMVFGSSIYTWMSGRIRVFDHPYFAVTDSDGKFEIKDAPVGKWRVVYWHEQGFHKGREGFLGFPIDVKADKPGGTTMELKPVPFEIVSPK